MRLAIADIRLDGGTQPRATIDYGVVADYKEAGARGDVLPPPVVFFDGQHYWLADGFHRVTAKAGEGFVEADVRQGSKEDAIWFSCGANQGHGFPRNNSDKRRAVETALKLKSGESDRAIAEHCGVGHSFVSDMRQAAAASLSTVDSAPATRNRTGKDGRKQKPASKARSVAARKKRAANRAPRRRKDAPAFSYDTVIALVLQLPIIQQRMLVRAVAAKLETAQ